ncbi:GPW/gp25 family protein [Roseospira navarrensis]|uniref:Phage baseplate protein n=1 Tax=Roseospira navarrensis TaxID=140058 RepID=A0A7X1ZHT0_9PROT|nr:GPW/gp25 family protein [Roseospira navarrensis]MQX37876.1 phage baseplate protein [Roseospira navarrensis]
MRGMNAGTGRDLGGLDHLRQSVRDILTTRIGTRVMRREYGSRLPDLVDNPMTPVLAMDLFAATAQALRQWEPRLSLTRIGITEAAPGRVTLALTGVYRPDGRTVTMDGIVLEAS